jgi:hypothetical protein
MVASRVMFVFIPLFLTLVITVLTAPVPDNQLVTEKNTNETITTVESVFYKDDTSESDESSEVVGSTPGEYKEEINVILEVVTSDFLLVNATEILNDVHENLQILDRLLFDTQGELSITTSTQIPQSSQIGAPDTAEGESTTDSIH